MGAEYERYQGVEKHSSGFKLLAAMGWKEGEGLVRYFFSFVCFSATWLLLLLLLICSALQGAKGQGRKEHIKVRRRQDSSGIGLVSSLRSVEQRFPPHLYFGHYICSCSIVILICSWDGLTGRGDQEIQGLDDWHGSL